MLYNPEHDHNNNHQMNQNDVNWLAMSCNDVQFSSLNESMLQTFPKMLNCEATSSWFPVAQSRMREGSSLYMGGSSSNSDIGIPTTSNSSASVNAAETNKEGLRAVWKVPVEQDEAALKKGKFPRYTQ